MKRRRREQGWTRKEALVVIAVLVVAFSCGGYLLWATLQQAREKARRINCAGNLKQVGLSLLMYSGDFDHYFPNDEGDDGQFAPFTRLKEQNYVSDGKIWWCPSVPVVYGEPVTITGPRSREDQTIVTYTRRPHRYPSNYRYVGSGLRDDVPEAKSVSLAFDQAGNHLRNEWMNVLWVDEHVEGARPGSSPQYHNGPPQ